MTQQQLDQRAAHIKDLLAQLEEIDGGNVDTPEARQKLDAIEAEVERPEGERKAPFGKKDEGSDSRFLAKKWPPGGTVS